MSEVVAVLVGQDVRALFGDRAGGYVEESVREHLARAVTFAEGKANSALARGDYDERRAWLDMLILLGAS